DLASPLMPSPHSDLPFPPYRALLATRQCHRSAAERDVDIAVGCGGLPVDAARPRAAGAGADGLGDRHHDLGRRAHLCLAGRRVGDATATTRGSAADLIRRVVALFVAGPLAALGYGRGRRR